MVAGPAGGDVPAWTFSLDADDPGPHWRGDALGSLMEPEAQVLEYGQTAKYGQYICSSATEGLTCWNTDQGIGIFLNRDGYTHLTAPSAG